MLFRLKIQAKKLTIKNIKYKKRQTEQAKISCSSDVKMLNFGKVVLHQHICFREITNCILNKHQKLTI